MKKRLISIIGPAAAAILLAASSLVADAHRLSLPKTNVAGKEYYYYDVKPDDNLYDISRQIEVSVDDIMRHNPAARDGVSSQMRLYFPVDEYVQTTVRSHTVASRESLYGIAHRYGVSTDDILLANPAARDGLREGMTLVIPAPDADTAAVADEPVRTPRTEREADATIRTEVAMAQTIITEDAVEDTAGETDEVIPEEIPDGGHAADATIRSEATLAVTVTESPLEIVIMEPFMLNDPNPARSAEHATDFYRGFLLAADSLSHDGRPVHITAIDTEGSDERVRQLTGTPALLRADLIVAPDNDAQIQILANALGERALIYNPSAVKNTLYLTDSAVIQANIPHDQMYDKAISAFGQLFDGYTTVFVRRNGGSADKEEFVDELRRRLTADGRLCLDITYDNALDDDNLAALVPGVSYVIVPVSGRRDEFNKFAPAIKALRDRAADPATVRVFGYPDWTVLRGSNLETLCDLDAVVYGRFYADSSDPATIDLARKFSHMYGSSWIDSAPNKAIEGFDTGMYIIGMLRDNDGDITAPELDYSGIQQDINLRSDDVEGCYNNSLYLINYTPSGAVVKTRL